VGPRFQIPRTRTQPRDKHNILLQNSEDNCTPSDWNDVNRAHGKNCDIASCGSATYPRSYTYINIRCSLNVSRNKNSAVGIAIGYGLDGIGVGVRVSVGARFVSSARRPDRFWPPSSGFREKNCRLTSN
jgi:hypothetical protein